MELHTSSVYQIGQDMNDKANTHITPTLSGDFVRGHGNAVDTIRTSVTRLAEGRGACIIVEGSEGLGKTRLLTHADKLASSRGISVARGAATGLDQRSSLSTLTATLRSCVPTSLLSGDSGRAPTSIYIEQLGAELVAKANSTPLLVAIDDIHDADEVTMLALHTLVPGLAHAPILWLLTRRPACEYGPTQKIIERLLRHDARQVKLPALSDEDVAELCANVTGCRPDLDLVAVASRVRNDPFLAAELVRALDRDGWIWRTGGRAGIRAKDSTVIDAGPPRELALPQDFLAAVQWRVGALSHAARTVLEAGAVLERDFTVHEVAEMTGLPIADLLHGAKDAVSSGKLVEGNDGLAFRHGLIREAMYDSLMCVVRRTLHLQAAALVEGEGRPPDEVAKHLARGEEKCPARVVTALRAGVDDLGDRSPAGVGELAMRLVDLERELDETAASLVADTFRVLASADRPDQARTLRECAMRKATEGSVAAGMLAETVDVERRSAPATSEATVPRTTTGRTTPETGGTAGTNWSSLTAAEIRVARLVSHGMTNQQVSSELFVSRHTVDSHLRHSFAKLNITSRVDLTRLFFTKAPDHVKT